MPAHSGANALALKARELHSVSLENAKPFCDTRKELKTWPKCSHTTLWNSEIVGKTTKILWGNPNEYKTKTLLTLSKREINMVTGVLTGHLGLQAHLHKIGAVGNSICRACGEVDESLEHFLCHCPAFANIRSQFMGADSISDLTQIGDIYWKTLRDFVKRTEFI